MTQTQKTINQNKNKKRIFGKIRFDLVNKFLVCLIIMLGVGFVVTINDLSIKGFVLQELKTKSQDLKADNTEAELAVMELESFENIETRAQELKMVKTDKIDYITITGGMVAKK